ncbi:MAG: hypothetical protein NT120_02970 [Candidatus Aenigmarchaeota archaeon]|nr:hypothetical protein [Candidatus Aenigmarchaeota archaeon]
MSKFTVVDDLLAPADTIVVRFQGKNPFAAASMVPGMLRQVLQVTSKDVLETEIKWDATRETREFFGKWMGKRKEDFWTKTIAEVIIQGEQESKEKTGWCRIQLRGVVQTEYEFTNPFQKPFWLLYNKYFYSKQRRAYIEQGKDFLYKMRNIFQNTLGITPAV